MTDGLPVVREAFPRTVRLVTTARLRDSVLLALVDQKELDALAEIEGATSQRLVAQQRGSPALDSKELIHGVPHATFVNAAFANAKPRELNRFNGPDRGAWYAALVVETALAEVQFHMTEFLARTGVFEATVEYAELFASFAGEFVDLRVDPEHPALSPDPAIGYAAGNAVADSARSNGLNGIIYPSVRHEGGTCFAALFPHAVQSVAQGDVYRLAWAGDQTPTIKKVRGT
jgi:RES domain-containing protein